MTNSKWETIVWTKIGSGTYNTAYRSADKRYVFKLKHTDLKEGVKEADTPERSVRLWNELNPGHKAFLARTQFGSGWICPFIKGQQASDEEINTTLISIFNRTGRIIADAPSDNNFLKTPEGKIVCIDVGLALQMEKNEENTFKRPLTRKKSIISLKMWEEVGFIDYFSNAQQTHPKSTATIQALFFIKEKRPDIFDATFLIKNVALTNLLVRGLKGLNVLENNEADADMKDIAAHDVNKAFQALQNERKTIFSNIQESCVVELKRYIKSRGTMDEKNEFSPSITTRLFRDKKLTQFKVGIIQQLINTIKNTKSIEEIEQAIRKTEKEPDALASKFCSGLALSISRCRAMLEVAKKEFDAAPLEMYESTNKP